MTAIEFENISKQYRLGLVSTQTLAHDINRWWQTSVLHKEDPYLKIGETNDRATKGMSEYVWALRDINFKVEQGDVVGIIGKNGAGKSTLLKLLSKVTGPTTGTIRARGRIGSLLEVGTGFHQEMTGRENIYLNGAILGMSHHEISRKLDEIVDFSGCERYIDTPVKRYSSGMMVRLGFAVAAHLDPEILVVDEVLAVGDAEFQKKAIGKMKDVSQGEGRTVLFVSHNMNSILNLCHNCIILEKGNIVYTGPSKIAVRQYLHSQLNGSNVDRQGDGTVVFGNYSLDNQTIEIGDDLTIQFDIFVMREYYSPLSVEITITSEDDEPIVNIANCDKCIDFGYLSKGVQKHVECTIKNVNLSPGGYFITLYMGTSTGVFDWVKYGIHFDVIQGYKFIERPVAYNSRYAIALQSNWIIG